MLVYEHATGAIGTTSFGEYLPIWVKQVPRESPLEAMYQAGDAIERLDPTYLPAGAKIEAANYNFNQADLMIDSPQPYQAVFHIFYFPGWTALVDGQPAPIAPVTERGLIGVTMPAGRHRLQFYFGETPLRRAADWLSAASLAVVVVLFFWVNVSRLRHFEERSDEKSPAHSTAKNCRGASSLPPWRVVQHNINGQRFLTIRQLVLLAGLALVLLAAKIFYIDHFDTPFKHTFAGVSVAGAGVSRQVNFGGQINLLGYDLDRQTAVPGQSFNLTVYWQARQPLLTNYSALAQLVDAERHLYANQDNLHPGQLMTTRWQPWSFTQDPHTLTIPFGTPPGAYFLVAGLYDPSTWARLPALTGGDPGWADTIAIPVTVTKAAQPSTVEDLGITWPVSQTCEVLKTSQVSAIRLLGATPERDAIRRNDFLRVALFWEATAAPTVDYSISLRLATAAGQVALTETGQPSYNRYSTTRWAAGERVRDNHALWIPAEFPAGMYRLQAQILDELGRPVSDWVELGRLDTPQ